MSKTFFSEYENANAILNGMDDCSDDFVQEFIKIHKQDINSEYMYSWLLRSFVDIVKIDHSVLHIACGTAGYTRLYNNVKRFVGVDFSKKMIQAANELHKDDKIDCSFYCCTFEEFESDEKFDVIYLGPYGHNVPYRLDVLEKAKKYLKPSGVIFCTIPNPEIKSCIGKIKETIKKTFMSKDLTYNSIHRLEKLITKANLENQISLRIKTCLGYVYCFVVKPNAQS